MSDQLMFWKPRPDCSLSPARIAQELTWGEDVEGLIDLPIKEVLDRLKVEFPQHDEKPGLLMIGTTGGPVETTWSWQHLSIKCPGILPADRERLVAVVAEFGCTVHEMQVDRPRFL
ncbi:MAG: hypothetical protein WD872_12720 [Pirellulaceae bacterium]